VNVSLRTIEGYPTSIYWYRSQQERDELAMRFSERAGTDWSVSVDQWGFIESACTKVPAPPSPSKPAVNGIVTDDEIVWTREIILANAELFGIDDPARFELEPAASYIRSESGEPYLHRRMARATQQAGVWPLTLGPQRTWLTLYEQPLQVGRKAPGERTGLETLCITGHLWPGAHLPDAPLVSREEVEAALSGQTHSYTRVSCLSQAAAPAAWRRTCSIPGDLVSTVETAMIASDDLTFLLAPRLLLRADGGLELRLVYHVQVKTPGVTEWRIDALTGEALSITAP